MDIPHSDDDSTQFENGQHDEVLVDAETVTRDQNGQYIEESNGLERVVVAHQRPSGQLDSQDLDSIRAKNVTMNQSGAEQIDAETVTITSGGAKSINATHVELRSSGAVMVSGESITVNQSSAVVIAGDHVEMSMSGAFAIQAEEVIIKGDSRTGLLIAKELKSEQEFRAVVGVIGKISNESKVSLMFDAKSALALGAGFAVVFRLLGRIFRR